MEDISSSKIPVPISFVNDIPQWELLPWRYFPVSIPTLNHPITSNLNAVKFDFVSSIDTIKTNTKINKTILLHTSPYSRLVNTPYEISLQKALEQPAQNDFNIRSTPSFIVNGNLVEGNKNTKEFRQIIDKILSE